MHVLSKFKWQKLKAGQVIKCLLHWMLLIIGNIVSSNIFFSEWFRNTVAMYCNILNEDIGFNCYLTDVYVAHDVVTYCYIVIIITYQHTHLRVFY